MVSVSWVHKVINRETVKEESVNLVKIVLAVLGTLTMYIPKYRNRERTGSMT